MPRVAPMTSSNNTKRGGEADAIPGTGEYGDSFPMLFVLCLQ